MSAVTNFNQVIGDLAKEQAAHGSAETLANNSDGCCAYIGDGDPEPPTKIDYVFSGSIGNAPGTLAPQKQTTPNGRFRQGQFRCLPKGLGSAYSSSSVTPPREVHRWLKAAGFTATFTTDHWVYTPTPHGSSYTVLTYRQYAQGMQWDMSEVIADFSYESVGLGVPIWTFDWSGLPSMPETQALPSVTYLATSVIPPVASAVIANIGDFAFGTGGLRKVSYKRNRDIATPRIQQNTAGGHAGFIPGRAAPMFEIEIERTALVDTPFHTTGGVDAEALREAATSVPVSVEYGGTANNTWSHAFANAQCVDVQPGAEGPLATVVLTMRAHASTPAANDYETIIFE